MDLVKTHLMYAVHEEVHQLRAQLLNMQARVATLEVFDIFFDYLSKGTIAGGEPATETAH